jgi:hypothetical protein
MHWIAWVDVERRLCSRHDHPGDAITANGLPETVSALATVSGAEGTVTVTLIRHM